MCAYDLIGFLGYNLLHHPLQPLAPVRHWGLYDLAVVGGMAFFLDSL